VQIQEIKIPNILEKVETEEAKNKEEIKDPYQGSATYLLYSITAVI
jgi:hypothetical protein